MHSICIHAYNASLCLLLVEVTPAGEDKSLGVSKPFGGGSSLLLASRKAMVLLYCHPDYSHFECKLDKDHDAVKEHKA